MEEIPFLVYELAATALPALLVLAICSKYRKDHALSKGSEGIASVLVLSVYVMAVFYLTGAGTLFDLLRHGFEYRPEQINLIPLLLDSYTMQYVLNVIMFIPLGFLVSYIWPSIAKLRYVLFYGAGFSLLIELSQLLNQRATDVDDLIMNTLGAVLGYVLFRLVARRRFRKAYPEQSSQRQAQARMDSSLQLQPQASDQSFNQGCSRVPQSTQSQLQALPRSLVHLPTQLHVPTSEPVQEHTVSAALADDWAAQHLTPPAQAANTSEHSNPGVARALILASAPALPALYLIAMFAGNFFLCNTLGLAKLMYGF